MSSRSTDYNYLWWSGHNFQHRQSLKHQLLETSRAYLRNGICSFPTLVSTCCSLLLERTLDQMTYWSYEYCRACIIFENTGPWCLCHRVVWIRPPEDSALMRHPSRQVHHLSAVLLIHPRMHVCVLGLIFRQLFLAVGFWWGDFTWPHLGGVINLPWIRQRSLQPWGGLERLHSCSPCMWREACATEKEQGQSPAACPPSASKSPPGLSKFSKRLSVIWLYFEQIFFVFFLRLSPLQYLFWCTSTIQLKIGKGPTVCLCANTMCVCMCACVWFCKSQQANDCKLFVLFEWSSKVIMSNKIYLLKCFLEIVKLQPCLQKFKSLHNQNCPKRFMCTYHFWTKKKA